MIGDGGWPVFDPGRNTLSDLYPYEVEIFQDIDIEIDFQVDDDKTQPMPSAWLVERCMTSVALGPTK